MSHILRTSLVPRTLAQMVTLGGTVERLGNGQILESFGCPEKAFWNLPCGELGSAERLQAEILCGVGTGRVTGCTGGDRKIS